MFVHQGSKRRLKVAEKEIRLLRKQARELSDRYHNLKVRHVHNINFVFPLFFSLTATTLKEKQKSFKTN